MLPPAAAPPHYFRKLAENYATYPNVGHFKNRQSAPVAGQTGKNITRTEISPRVLFFPLAKAASLHTEKYEPKRGEPTFFFFDTTVRTRKSAAEAASTPMRKTLRPQHKTTICTGKFSLYHFRRRQRQYFFLQAKLTAGNEEYSKDRHLKERDRRNCNQVAAASAVCCLPLPVTKAK